MVLKSHSKSLPSQNDHLKTLFIETLEDCRYSYAEIEIRIGSIDSSESEEWNEKKFTKSKSAQVMP